MGNSLNKVPRLSPASPPAVPEAAPAAASTSRSTPVQQQQQRRHRTLPTTTELPGQEMLSILLEHESITTDSALFLAMDWPPAHQPPVPSLTSAPPASLGESIKAALQQAAATAAGTSSTATGSPPPPAAAAADTQALSHLNLQSVGFEFLEDLTLLECLPTHSLTHLKYVSVPEFDDLQTRRAVAALARLTALQRLEILMMASTGVDRLAPALTALTNLTSIEIGGVYYPASLTNLPGQLRDLGLSFSYRTSEDSDSEYDSDNDEDEDWLPDRRACFEPMHLQHLTACTGLYGTEVVLRRDDELPPNLLDLQCGKCLYVQPLLPLAQLTHLHMLDSNMAPAELQKLRGLTSLTRLCLEYQCRSNFVLDPALASVWPLLPIRQLSISAKENPFQGNTGVRVSAALAGALGSLTGLTELHLTHFGSIDCTIANFCSILSRLSNLCTLDIQAVDFHHAPLAQLAQLRTGEALFVGPLLHTVLSLPKLDSLLLGMSLLSTACQLTAATHLTCLYLTCSESDSFCYNSIVCSLTGLRELGMAFDDNIDDALMPVIASNLPHLSSLDLGGTSVTDRGIECLSSMQFLQRLVVENTDVSRQAVLRAKAAGWPKALHALT